MIGVIALTLAGILLAQLGELAAAENGSVPRDVSFLAPIQQAASPLRVEVSNVADEASTFGFIGYGWPALLALVAWIYAWRTEEFKTVARVGGWLFLAWAALRFPNGAMGFLWVMAAFVLVHLIIPALRQLWRVPAKPEPKSLPPKHDAAPAAAAVIIGLLLLSGTMRGGPIGFQPVLKNEPRAESVTHDIRVDDKFVLGTAKIHWPALKGQSLPLLQKPAVLTHLAIPRSLKLVQNDDGKTQDLVAEANGTFDIDVEYQLQIVKGITESDFTLPVRSGLVNRLNLTVLNSDVDVLTPWQAVSLERQSIGSNTVAKLVLSPGNDVRVAWKPRSRDVKREKPVFYAEISQLYAPAAGVIEGVHHVSIRPAQGELNEVILDVPRGMTITDVTTGTRQEEPAKKKKNQNATPSVATVSLWRFDPEARKLRVTLNPAQSRPFAFSCVRKSRRGRCRLSNQSV
jgi:hypothetical protein